MRVVFMGTPQFAVPSLRALVRSRYQVCAVFTQPDRPAGRGRKILPPPVKRFALDSSIPVYQPDRIRTEESRRAIEAASPDFLVVVAYGQILPSWLLQLPRLAPINVHASLLPAYRGAAPIPWAILNGESVTGVTTMIMEEALDSGPVLLRQEVPIPLAATSGEMEEQLSEIGAKLLITTLKGFAEGSIIPAAQDTSRATLAPKLNKEMAVISWESAALTIHNQIRAMNPWPLAFTEFRNQRLQVFRSLPVDKGARSPRCEPGTILGVSAGGVRVQCGSDTMLELVEVQLAGRNPVSGIEFANGARLRSGELFVRPWR